MAHTETLISIFILQLRYADYKHVLARNRRSVEIILKQSKLVLYTKQRSRYVHRKTINFYV